MKHSRLWLAVLLPLLLTLPGCEIIGGIFRAGVWVGIILVLLVVGLIVWLLTRRA